jgi:DNA-binding transcriptional ArsR family regulator
VLARLELLRTSTRVRRDYVQLIADTWATVGDVWEQEGRAAVEAAVASRRRAAASGAPWQEVAGAACDPAMLEDLVSRLGPNDEVVVVPAFFTHLGLLVDLPGILVVGVRTESAGAQSRARTEALANRLKALADPTRLAILDTLGGGPKTVTELAKTFELAQPTVSNHVKLLRDAGLVANVHNGARRELMVRSETVTDLLDHLGTVLRRVAG